MSAEAIFYANNVCKLQDPGARQELAALAWVASNATPATVFLSNKASREITGVRSENAIKKRRAKLVEAGEIRVLRIGGRARDGSPEATDFDLVGVRQWMRAGKPPRSEWAGPKKEPAPADANASPQKMRGVASFNDPLTHQKMTPIEALRKASEELETEQRANAPKETEQNPSLPPSSERSEETKRKLRGQGAEQIHADDDSAWLRELQARPEYAHLNVREIAGKCDRWHRTKRQRGAHREDIVRWLDNEKPPRRPIDPKAYGGGTSTPKVVRDDFSELMRELEDQGGQPAGPRPIRTAMEEAAREKEWQGKIVQLAAAC
jgi:hypothetical protein